MTRNLIILLFITSFTLSVAAQQTGTKGAKVVGNELATQTKKGNTYALIVGISKYQFPDTYVPLQFADKDARIFYTYLTSDAGGKIKDEFIDTLFNEHATYGEVMRSLLSIKERMNEGDLLYFYFSGHGDAYNASLTFLLPFDAPAGKGKSDKNHYLTGSTVLNLHTIKNIFLELTSTGKKVVFISDACRTNELSGGETGRTSVFKRIMEEDAGEIRFSSCSSNQVSFEGPQWGNGRGLFSWHLVNGLIGMADVSPPDGEVTVDELKAYIEQNVKNATYDKTAKVYRQTPQFACTIENCETIVLNVVNEREKERLALELQKGGNTFFQDALAMHTPGKGVDLPAEMQKIGKKHLYDQFIGHINNQQLIGKLSAASVFEDIAADKEIPKSLINEFRGILSSYLITDVNKVINTYLNASQNNNLYTYDYFYSAYLKLKKFREIADPLFYNEVDVKVNLLFLESHANWKATRSKELLHCLALVDSAVALKPEAAYLYNLKGLMHQKLKQYKEAEKAFRTGIKMAPGWLYPTNNLGVMYSYLLEEDSTFYYYFKALALDTNYQTTYSAIANAYSFWGKNDSSLLYILRGLSKDPEDPYLNWQRGFHYYNQGEWNNALRYFRKTIQVDSSNTLGYEGCIRVHLKNFVSIDSVLYYRDLMLAKDPTNPEAFNNLGNIMSEFEWDSLALFFYNKAIMYDSLNTDYWNNKAYTLKQLGSYNQAIGTYKKSIKFDSTNASTYYGLAMLFYSIGQKQNAVQEFEKSASHNPFNHMTYYNLGYIYAELNDFVNAEKNYLFSLEKNPNYADTYYELARLKAMQGKFSEALKYLDTSLLMKLIDKNYVEQDSAFVSLVKEEGFKSLLKKHYGQ